MSTAVAAPRVARAIRSIVSSAIAWFLFTFALVVLCGSIARLSAIGGACAVGGPFEITQQCSDLDAIGVPLSILGGWVAVGIAMLGARGLGSPLEILAWPIVFTVLGVQFLVSGIPTGDWAYNLCGVIFILMGVPVLALILKVDAVRGLVGRSDLWGNRVVVADLAAGQRLLFVLTGSLIPLAGAASGIATAAALGYLG